MILNKCAVAQCRERPHKAIKIAIGGKPVEQSRVGVVTRGGQGGQGGQGEEEGQDTEPSDHPLHGCVVKAIGARTAAYLQSPRFLNQRKNRIYSHYVWDTRMVGIISPLPAGTAVI